MKCCESSILERIARVAATPGTATLGTATPGTETSGTGTSGPGTPGTETPGTGTKVLNKSECGQIWWNSLPDHQKNVIKAIPNFNAEIFEQCTGIKI